MLFKCFTYFTKRVPTDNFLSKNNRPLLAYVVEQNKKACHRILFDTNLYNKSATRMSIIALRNYSFIFYDASF